MMGRGLDFRRVESLFRNATILHLGKLVSFVVMIRDQSISIVVGWRRIFLLLECEGFSARSWSGDRAHTDCYYLLPSFLLSLLHIASYLDIQHYLYPLLFSCFCLVSIRPLC